MNVKVQTTVHKIIEFFKEWDFVIYVLLVLVAFLGTVIGLLCFMEANDAERREAADKLEASHRYTIGHWHAGDTAHASLYYTDAYEVDGPLVKFTDHDGHNLRISGDVTIAENNKN